MLEVKVRLFGAFRDFSQSGSLLMVCAPGSTIADVRAQLQSQLDILKPGPQAAALLQQSVFADENAILAEDLRLERSQELAIIPPVCGG